MKPRWTARILALAILLFGLPFYFGYGNPLPFMNPDYTLFDNVWLSIFPLMLAGLALGWWREKVGGYLITVPVALGEVASVLSDKGLVLVMLVPLAVGILYLWNGYSRNSHRE